MNADTCAFWALPTGPRRHYAAAYFVVVTPQWLRVWQGKALSDEQIAQLPTVPTPDELASWQMNEQAARRQQVR